jgi:hypothetical protein
MTMSSASPSPSSPRRRTAKQAPPQAVASAADQQTRAAEPSSEEIAEAAYHRYLSRGGGDGQDFDDWIEAERELKSRR